MTKRKKSHLKERLGKVLPYILVGGVTLGLVFVGSLDKQNQDVNLSLDTFATADESNISVDQISELYMVADLSDALGLASASDVASNYVSSNTMYGSGQTASLAGKLEKPNLTDAGVSRGIIEHVVEEGESVESIAAYYGVSSDQIRWSNGLKSSEVAAGTVLKIPSSSGIVYTVKNGETAESIAAKYGSSAEEIIALNDLEVSGVTEGMQIFIKDGELPVTERPEYVAPAVTTRTAYAYTYLGDTSSRTGLMCNRNLGAGQCTTWAWLKRPDLGFIKANASAWASIAQSGGKLVNRTPSPGAVFQTPSGWYGHVGYVESVNGDGSINVSERNYAGCYGVLFSTIPASEVGKFNYIH